MSKRNLIILIVVVLVIVVAGFFTLLSLQGTGNNTQQTTGINFISNFFPFGKSTTVPQTTEKPVDVSGYTPSSTEGNATNKLRKISNLQIAGYGVFSKERFKDVTVLPTTETTTPTAPQTEFAPAIRYVDKSTGNIYQTFADNVYEQKITTNTIPQVHEAFFGNKGNSVIMRYLKENTETIETFVGSLPAEILGGDTFENNQISGTFLPEKISDLSLSPDTLKIFYLFGTNDSVNGITSSYLGEKKTQIFNSPFTEWLSMWPNNNMITLTTKPSSSVLGYMYAVNPAKKDFNKVLSGIKGLTTLTSPSGKLVLYSDNNLALSIYNTEKKETISSGVRTLPEKCIWTSSNTSIYCAVPKSFDRGSYPDIWYQGEVFFNDEIWKINPLTGNGTLIMDPSTEPGGDTVDGTKLALDDSGNYLFFIDKRTSYLWEYDLR